MRLGLPSIRRKSPAAAVRAVVFAALPIRFSSCSLTVGCSAGVLRPYHDHRNVSKAVIPPIRTQAIRQPTLSEIAVNNSGAAETPIVVAPSTRPFAQARLLNGIQAFAMRPAAGNRGEVKAPIRNRT